MSDSNEQEYMQNGLEAPNMGDFNAAQVFFKQAIRVNNSNEEAWLSLARTYPTEPDKALKCYENVLKINPLNSEAQGMIDRLSAAAAAARPSQSISVWTYAALTSSTATFAKATARPARANSCRTGFAL